MSSSWLFDQERQEYYYWSTTEGCYVYQSGRKVIPHAEGSTTGQESSASQYSQYGAAAPRAASQLSQPDSISQALGGLTISQESRNADFTQQYPYTTGSGSTGYQYAENAYGESSTPFLQKDPKDQITEPSLYDIGFVAYAKVNDTSKAVGVYRGYKVRQPADEFFKRGKVFKVLWPEPLHGSNGNMTVVTEIKGQSREYATKIRYFVVVKEGHDACSCLPILTYGKQGCSQKENLKWQHSVVYSTRNEPKLRRCERPKEGEAPMMKAIRVKAKDPTDKLDELCRINYSKIYTVGHNFEVSNFGDVQKAYIERLSLQWKYVRDRSSGSSAGGGAGNNDDDEEDEDEDDEEGEEGEDDDDEDDEDDDDDE